MYASRSTDLLFREEGREEEVVVPGLEIFVHFNIGTLNTQNCAGPPANGEELTTTEDEAYAEESTTLDST